MPDRVANHQILLCRTDRLVAVQLRSTVISLENGSVAPTSRRSEMATLRTAICTLLAGCIGIPLTQHLGGCLSIVLGFDFGLTHRPASHEGGERFGTVEAFQHDLETGGDWCGQKHADRSPHHSPEHQG